MPFVYVPMPVAHLGLTAVMAFLGMLGALGIIAAYRSAPAVIVAPMQYSQIIWAVLYGWLFFDETRGPMTAIGSAVIIAAGIYIVLREGTPRVSQNRPCWKAAPEWRSAPSPASQLAETLREVGRPGVNAYGD